MHSIILSAHVVNPIVHRDEHLRVRFVIRAHGQCTGPIERLWIRLDGDTEEVIYKEAGIRFDLPRAHWRSFHARRERGAASGPSRWSLRVSKHGAHKLR